MGSVAEYMNLDRDSRACSLEFLNLHPDLATRDGSAYDDPAGVYLSSVLWPAPERVTRI
jgi:hypothetical protein